MNKVIQNTNFFILLWLLLIPSIALGQGSRYKGTYKKASSTDYVNKKNIVIEGLEFSDANNRTLSLWSCENIIIKNCKFKDVNMAVAIYAENSKNILVTDCTFENVHGAFIAGSCKGNIKFEHNDVKNILGTLRGGLAFSNAVHFNNCTGAGNSIAYNVIENIAGESSPEDNIAIYKSQGTPESPIAIKGNWIRGGGPSMSGGGILLGDYGGSYQVAEDNILVNPGQYGMGIGGGHNMTLRNNKIFSEKLPFTNVGLSICNWSENQTGKSYNITVQNNDVNWTHKDGHQNKWWVYKNMSHLKGLETNDYNPNLNKSILPEDILNRSREIEEKPSFPESNIPVIGLGQGSRYKGTYKKASSTDYVNKKNIVIEGLEFSDANNRTLSLWSCENIIIKNCKFKDVNMAVAIYAENSKNILVTDCTFENVHGAFIAGSCKGNIKFEYNDVINILGTLRGGLAFSNAVHFNNCTGAGNSIAYNVIENIAGESSPEDNIAIYKSQGTPESPIAIRGNWIRGGGPSVSGGGILLGDYGGSYQVAEDNILVNPGQYGMGISGGHNMTLRNNKIFSEKLPYTNVGLLICNWSENQTGESYNITVQNNEINWTHKDGHQNKWWIYKNMNHLKGLETNSYNPNLNKSILPEDIFNGSREIEKQKSSLPESNITQVYVDSFNRIAIKYYVAPMPQAYVELFTSSGQKIKDMKLHRFNTAFDLKLSKGTYYVKVTYPDLGRTETNEISVD